MAIEATLAATTRVATTNLNSDGNLHAPLTGEGLRWYKRSRHCCFIVAEGALNLSIFPGAMTLAGVQSLVVDFTTLQTGGSPRLQQDFEQVVLRQLWATPPIVFVVLIGAPQVSAPHCFCSPSAAIGTPKKSTEISNTLMCVMGTSSWDSLPDASPH
jgi:hypothetical protein